jgi:hypothetical protein
MANLSQHIEARNDQDLRARFIAAAEQAGISNAAAWVDAQMGKLVSVDLGETTVADVHAYAVSTYNPTPRPGVNPAAVTDVQIAAAIGLVAAPAPVEE